ncbi:unnamed protein product [Withania somnifera]
MKKPKASAGITTPSEPPFATQFIQPEPQKLEFQPTNSQESIIIDLRKLSDALFAFGRCLTDVEKHIDSVRTSIDSTVLILTPRPVTLPMPESVPEPEPEPVPNPSCESDPSEEEEEEEEEEEVKSGTRSELESLCKTTNSVGLKKYLITHLSDIDELREQVPKALKLSPNPERFVLGSGGLATLLALEGFMLMMGEAKDEVRVVEIEKEAKEEAEKAALVWRGRMISQEGISKAHEMDARGLLLLIGCFGIPKGFLDRDVRYLVETSGACEISGALRRSSVLMEKVPDIIQWMLKNNIVVAAVDVAYTFGMEDRFNPRKILTSFLHNSEVSHLNSTKGLEQGSAVRAGKKKYSSDLKSVSDCLERHKIDPSKLLFGWQIDVRIMNLENDIAELNVRIGEKELAELTKHMGGDQKMTQKRKNDETESSAIINHVDASSAALLECGGTPGLIYVYSLPPSVLRGAIAGSVHANAVGSLVGPMGGIVAMDGAGASQSVKGGSFVGVHGATLVDHTHGQIGSHAGQLYGPRGSGSMGLPNTVPGDAYRPSPYLEGSAGLPNTIAGDAYRPPPYSEGSTGSPSTIPAPYQFADTVPATELYRSSGSRAVEAIPSAALAHPSSSLYWQR